MKTMIDLPDELIEEAMQLTDIKTKTQVMSRSQALAWECLPSSSA